MTPSSNSLHEVVKGLEKPKPKLDRLYDSDETKKAAKLLGSKGGKKGGAARANALTKERRVEIAKMGGKAARKNLGK